MSEPFQKCQEWITKFRRHGHGQSVQKFHSSETITCFAVANTPAPAQSYS